METEMDNDEKFDDEEERQRFEDNYSQFADRYKKSMEWQRYLVEQFAKGNKFIHIPEQFTGIKNFPLYLVMLRKDTSDTDSPMTVSSMFSMILN